MTKKVNLDDHDDGGVSKIMLEKHKKQKMPAITNSNSNSRPTTANKSRPTTASNKK